MEITDPRQQHQIVIEQVRSRALDSLRPGQLLSARVVLPTQGQQVRLRIAGTELLARTGVSLQAGEPLLLKVLRPKNPLQLQLVRPPADSRQIVDAMRMALPREIPVSELLARLQPIQYRQPQPSLNAPLQTIATRSGPVLGALHAQSGKNTQPVTGGTVDSRLLSALLRAPGGVRLLDSIQQVLGHRIDTTEVLTPEKLRSAFLSSGLFMESTLASGDRPANDLKAGLLQLLFQLRIHLQGRASASASGGREKPPDMTSRPPSSAAAAGTLQSLLTDLLSKTEGGLARILLNQLASTPQAESATQHWHFELPLGSGDGIDTFRVRIADEGAGQSRDSASRWSVKLEFDLEPLGPVTANLTLQGEEISSFFTAERGESARSLQRAMPLLKDAFVQAGLKVGRLAANEGKVDSRPRLPYALVDEQA